VRLAQPKTAAARRQIALPRFLGKELARHLAEWPIEREGFGRLCDFGNDPGPSTTDQRSRCGNQNHPRPAGDPG
jgi:hypothetical protein